MVLRACLSGLAVAVCLCLCADADELKTYELVFKDHTATPEEIHVPAGEAFVVHVVNSNGEADEFEMLIPFVERAVPPGGDMRVRVRPLAPGKFPFFGESDPDGEKGLIVSE